MAASPLGAIHARRRATVWVIIPTVWEFAAIADPAGIAMRAPVKMSKVRQIKGEFDMRTMKHGLTAVTCLRNRT